MKIEIWSRFPAAVRDHLVERMRDRCISLEDLNQLRLWMESKPDVPDGPSYKEFGSFKLCGEGKYPKTFLLPGQLAKGQKLYDKIKPGMRGPSFLAFFESWSGQALLR